MANNIQLVKIVEGESLFQFIRNFSKQEGSHRVFHRLCSLMRRTGAKNVVVEKLRLNYPLVASEKKDLNNYYDQVVKIVAYKFTFISRDISRLEEISELDNNCFLSSAVVLNYEDPEEGWKTYIPKAIVTIPKMPIHNGSITIPILNSYFHSYKNFSCDVRISENGEAHRFNIYGSYFCQQNGITSVCAHAALCMTINNYNFGALYGNDPRREVTTSDINTILSIDHKSLANRFGKSGNRKGLEGEEIAEVLDRYELKFSYTDFQEKYKKNYGEWTYSYIESKFPVLLMFTGAKKELPGHLVPILGHTLNGDIWEPEAETKYPLSRPLKRLELFLSASAWVDHFIMHDDNFGMYYDLPVKSLLKRNKWNERNYKFRAMYTFAIVPKILTTSLWEVQNASKVVTYDFFQNGYLQDRLAGKESSFWIDELFSTDRPCIVRTLAISNIDYRKSLESFRDFKGRKFSEVELELLTDDLPQLFWLSEITLPDLYTANKSKLIDFIYACNRPETDNPEITDGWLQIRYPGLLLKRDSSSYDLSVETHFPLFRFPGMNTLDW